MDTGPDDPPRSRPTLPILGLARLNRTQTPGKKTLQQTSRVNNGVSLQGAVAPNAAHQRCPQHKCCSALPRPTQHPSPTPGSRGGTAPASPPRRSGLSLLLLLPSGVAVVAPCPHRSAAGAAGARAPPARPAPTAAPGPGPATVEASWSGRGLLRHCAPARSHPLGAASPSARRAGPAALLGPHPEARQLRAGHCGAGGGAILGGGARL